MGYDRVISSRDGNIMDAADLKFFEQVAQSGGMSRAAEKLNTVQSNVTRRIRALESELNVSLFNRTGRGVSLTQLPCA